METGILYQIVSVITDISKMGPVFVNNVVLDVKLVYQIQTTVQCVTKTLSEILNQLVNVFKVTMKFPINRFVNNVAILANLVKFLKTIAVFVLIPQE